MSTTILVSPRSLQPIEFRDSQIEEACLERYQEKESTCAVPPNRGTILRSPWVVEARE